MLALVISRQIPGYASELFFTDRTLSRLRKICLKRTDKKYLQMYITTTAARTLLSNDAGVEFGLYMPGVQLG